MTAGGPAPDVGAGGSSAARAAWGAIGSAGAARVFSVLATTTGLFLSARWLGPEGRGTIVAVTTWTVVVGTLAHGSLGQVALQERSAGRGADLGGLVGSLMLVAGVLTGVGWSVAALFVLSPWDTPVRGVPDAVFALGFAALPFVIWEQYGGFLLMSIDRLAVHNRAQIVGRTLDLVLLVIGVKALGYGVRAALAASVLGQAAVAMYGVPTLWRASGRLRPDRSVIRRLLRGGVQLHLGAVGALLVSYVDVLVVQHYLGARETGYYQLAVQFAAVMLIVPQVVAQVFYARVAVHGADGAWPEQRRMIGYLLLLLAVGCAVAALAARTIIEITVGHAFVPAVPVFQVILVSVLGRAVGFVMAPQWIGRGLFWEASLVTLALGICDVGLAIVLVPRLGVMGAAYASVIAYSTGALVNLVLALRIDSGGARARA